MQPHKEICCTPGSFLPGLSDPSTEVWVAEKVEARARGLHLVSVRLDEPNDLEGPSFACARAEAARGGTGGPGAEASNRWAAQTNVQEE